MPKYRIQDLLDNSARQLEDMPEEKLAEFREGFADRETLESAPVVIAMVDGAAMLVEGRQRLLILLASGREDGLLNANESVIVKGVTTREQAELEAITRNVNRRQLTAEQLTPVAIKLRDVHHLNQTQVGKVLGVTQSWVSKLFRQAEREAVAEATQKMADALEPVDPTGALTGVKPTLHVVPEQGASPENGLESEDTGTAPAVNDPLAINDPPAGPGPYHGPTGDRADVAKAVSDATATVHDAALAARKPVPPTAPVRPAPPVGMQALQGMASGVFMAINDAAGAMTVDERGSVNIDSWIVSVLPGREQRAEKIRDALTRASERYAALAARIDAALTAEKAKV